jgi:hypothetical protein
MRLGSHPGGRDGLLDTGHVRRRQVDRKRTERVGDLRRVGAPITGTIACPSVIVSTRAMANCEALTCFSAARF